MLFSNLSSYDMQVYVYDVSMMYVWKKNKNFFYPTTLKVG